jgi:hypothetical protein
MSNAISPVTLMNAWTPSGAEPPTLAPQPPAASSAQADPSVMASSATPPGAAATATAPASPELDLLSKELSKPTGDPSKGSPWWRRHLFSAGLFFAGFVCGVVAMKVFAPRSLSPASASAAAFVPQSGPTHSQNPATRPTDTVSRGTRQSASPAATSAKPATANPAQDDADYPAKRSSLLSTLTTLRSQIEMYKQQHGDRLPELSKYPEWAQLTRRTRADGTPATDGTFGPYIMSAPANPLNGFTGIGLIKKVPAPGTVMRAEKLGFIFSTTTGEVVATDRDGKTVFDELGSARSARPAATSAVRPSFGAADKQRAASSLLQTLRSEIDRYRLQHNDLNPDFVRYPAWEQLLRRTTQTGAIATPAAKEGYGPYLAQPPTNPVNGYVAVEAVPAIKSYKPHQKIGYVFETSTGRVFATDSTGALLKE